MRDGADYRDTTGIPTTLIGKAGTGAEMAAVQLLVLEAGGLAVYPMPETGSLSIGRAEDADVRLSDQLASRRHATLHLAPLSLEDNQSANGTLLDGHPLAPGERASLELGQSVYIGNSLL